VPRECRTFDGREKHNRLVEILQNFLEGVHWTNNVGWLRGHFVLLLFRFIFLLLVVVVVALIFAVKFLLNFLKNFLEITVFEEFTAETAGQ
jgi:hypothetical protein